jgi:hypothetical protein
MSLLQKAQELHKFATQIENTCTTLEYFEHRLHVASTSLVLMALCPDIESAHKNGIFAVIKEAFQNNQLDISLSLPIVISFIESKSCIKPIKTWDELVEALKIVEP